MSGDPLPVPAGVRPETAPAGAGPARRVEAGASPVEPFPYAISLDREVVSGAGGDYRMRGRLAHPGPGAVELGGGGGADLQLGFVVFSAATQRRVFEDRARFEGRVLAPGTDHPFTIAIPRRILAEDSYLCLVDFLYEDLFWFREKRQGSGGTFAFSLSGEAGAGAAPPAPGGARIASDEVGEADIPRLLAEAFAAHDFSGDRALAFLRDPRPRAGVAGIEPALLAALNRQVPAGDDVLPLTDLMRHLAALRRAGSGPSPGTRSARFDLLRALLPTLHELSDRPDELIPAETVRHLNAPVLADGIFDVPMTRMMLWYWLSEGRPIRAEMRMDSEDVHWWWASEAMPANRIPPVFLGPETAEHLAAPHEDFAARILPLSRFFHRVHRQSRALQARYDLRTDAGLLAYSFGCLLHNVSNGINARLFGSATLDFWTAPAGRGGNRFEFALGLQDPVFRERARRLPAPAGPVPAGLARGLRHADPAWRPLLSERSRRRCPGTPAGAGAGEAVTVAGLFRSQSGLGANARMSRRTFEALGLATNAFDVEAKAFVNPPGAETPALCLYHVNADAVPVAMLENRHRSVRTRAKAGFFLWELDALPDSHRLGMALVDEIWTPSRFLQDIYAGQTDRPVFCVGKHLAAPDLPPPPGDGRRPFTFLVSFDSHSGVERKNPLAAVQAFRAAFAPTDRDVALVVKTTPSMPGHWGDPREQWLRIREAAGRDGRITIVSDRLPEERFFRMINACDCVVSPHRAEGFGYVPAYALHYGKAVVSTDYSGTRDFCTPETAYPVACRLKDVEPGEFIAEARGARWAEIDFDHLVATLRQVVADEGGRRDRAEKGRALVRARYSPAAHEARYRARLADLGYRSMP